MNKKGQTGLIILFVVAIVLITFLIILGITNYRGGMKKDITFIERLKFSNQSVAPNETLVENCNSLYETSMPQTYFLQMYDCLADDITLEKIEVIVPYQNLTKELLDTQCECITEGKRTCKIYKCGETEVWGKL